MSENDKLKQAGLKVTTPRVKILSILANASDKHLSAEDVYKMLQQSNQDVSLATVYRVLSQFELAGLVYKHHFEGEHAVFEVSKGHHDHLICTECGAVVEFCDTDIQARQKQIAKDHGYQLTSYTLHILGLCEKCKA